MRELFDKKSKEIIKNEDRFQNILNPKLFIEDCEKICIRTKSGLRIILINEILYCEACGRDTCIHTLKKIIIISQNLKIIENILSKDLFIRTHHSTLININHVSEYSSISNDITLTNNLKVKISTRKKKYFLQKISSYYI